MSPRLMRPPEREAWSHEFSSGRLLEQGEFRGRFRQQVGKRIRGTGNRYSPGATWMWPSPFWIADSRVAQ